VTDVFLSYNREDQARAKLFVEAFEAQGLKVWWDVGLRSGDAYDEVTESALHTAKAVVVLWSKKSVASPWVRAEATLADRKKTLLPCMIEPCERPIMFELTQTAELSRWLGNAEDPAWVAFLEDVHRLVKKGEPATASNQTTAATSGPVLTSSAVGRSAPQSARGSWLFKILQGRSLRIGALTVLALLVVAVAFAGFIWRQQSQFAETNQRLAVLRFETVGDTPTYFAEGLADELITQARFISGLEVTARSSSFALADTSPHGAAKQLGATLVLTGSVQRFPNALLVRAELVSAMDGRLIWRETFESPLDQALSLQRTIALRISAAARLRLDVSPHRRVKPAALDLYLRAREEYERGWGARDEGVESAPTALLRRAVAIDPQFAEAWALLGAVELSDWAAGRREASSDKEIADALGPALDAASRALAIDPNLVRPHETRAVAFAASGRWLEAQEADDEAERRGGYGRLPELTGRFGEMRARSQRVVELDPLNGRARYFLGAACTMVADFACAQAESARYFELNPNDPRAFFNLLEDTVDKGDITGARRMITEHPAVVRQIYAFAPFNAQYLRFRLGDGPPPSSAQIIENGPVITSVNYLLATGQWRAAIPLLSAWPQNRLNSLLLEREAAPLRQTGEFWVIMKRLSLLQYWQESKRWPDFCAQEPVCAAYGGPSPK
jgi:TolB-like protein